MVRGHIAPRVGGAREHEVPSTMASNVEQAGLIAEDDRMTRPTLEANLQRWGYRVVVTCDGTSAYEALCRDDAPPLAILDWMMPGMDGVTVCRTLRHSPVRRVPYIILLTARGDQADKVAGLDGGADDYIIKPFDRDELRA